MGRASVLLLRRLQDVLRLQPADRTAGQEFLGAAAARNGVVSFSLPFAGDHSDPARLPGRGQGRQNTGKSAFPASGRISFALNAGPWSPAKTDS